jgi:hypothetical protein
VTVRSFEDTGLDVVEVADIAALRSGCWSPDRPHVVRVRSVDGNWQDLHADDVVVRPGWVHWVHPVVHGTSDVLAAQSKKQRQRSHAALRALSAMAMEVHDPVDAAALDEWAQLYSAQVGRMRYGRNLAAAFRRGVLAPDSGHALVGWRKDGRLLCGCVVQRDTERSALVTRFSAVVAGERAEDLPRGMYLALADLAARHGLRWATLGNDVNFYGAVVRPGLCSFKLRLGFRPVPSDLFGVGGGPVAERVINLTGLESPVLRFAYRRERDPAATIEDFVAGPDCLELVSVSAPGRRNEILESLPGHRRILLDD